MAAKAAERDCNIVRLKMAGGTLLLEGLILCGH